MKFLKIKYILIFVVFTMVQSCIEPSEIDPIVSYEEPNIGSEEALKWGEMTLKTMHKMPGNTPVYGSRTLGLMGLTMYESVVHGSKNRVSLAGQINDLYDLPMPKDTANINWVVVMNTAQAFVLKNSFIYAVESKLMAIDSLEAAINKSYSIKISKVVMDNSLEYGKILARSIWNWSMTDGGHEAYYRNFDGNYAYPMRAGNWVPPAIGQLVSPFPLQPYWGKNRTFAKSNNLPVPTFLTYSQAKDSPYYKQFENVYQKRLTLTQEEKEIAAFWADDPSETFSPPGHSYSIANIVVKQTNVNLFKAAETYAHVGMAVADAFINCWKTKYTYHSERPNIYIIKVIDPMYSQFWPEPPFPAFYSGHATQAAAAAAVLTKLFGPSFKYTDTSHEGRPADKDRKIEFKNISYTSFTQAAEEAGLSRIYGGIHIPQDNIIGLQEGAKCGNNINQFIWRK